MSDPIVDRILDWFRKHTKADAQSLGPLGIGAFCYDAELWRLDIPLIYGTVSIGPFDCLRGMPASVSTRLAKDQDAFPHLLITFANLLDVTLGHEDVGHSSISPFATQLLHAGSKALATAAELLLPTRPQTTSLGQSRLAAEIYLKLLLAHRDGLDDVQARQTYGHDLSRLLKRSQAILGSSDLDNLGQMLSVFPPIADRYQGTPWPIIALWQGYSLALHIAATSIRQLTGRDTRSQLA